MYTGGTMKLWPHSPRKSSRVIIIREGKVLVFHRKRYSRMTGEWIEYYSIPGGGIDKGETAEAAAVRELKEEMGIDIRLGMHVARSVGPRFEHQIFIGDIMSGEPYFVQDSEEAATSSEHNQFVVEWVDVDSLTPEKLRYYGHYCELIKQLAQGEIPTQTLQLDSLGRVY